MHMFDAEWRSRVSENCPSGSWVCELLTEHQIGETYINNLRNWLDELPAEEKIKKDFIKRLESTENTAHWGALNEIIWWRVLQTQNSESSFIPTGAGSRPDLKVHYPVKYLTEITTLNRSKEDSLAWESGSVIELNDKKAIRRLLGKLTSEKICQLQYATDHELPGVLVIFDTSTFSNFGTDFKISLVNHLYGEPDNAANLPNQLSAIVYVEIQFIDGNFQLSTCRCGVLHNPNAKYSLSHDALIVFEQYQKSTEPENSHSTKTMLQI